MKATKAIISFNTPILSPTIIPMNVINMLLKLQRAAINNMKQLRMSRRQSVVG